MRLTNVHILYFYLINVINIYSLTINSVYVIVDPLSTNKKPIMALKDHYDRDEENIGAINSYLSAVYIRGAGNDLWYRMEDQQNNYILHSNDSLSIPMSLTLTFTAEPTTNYSWYTFLSNLEGTTIYHLYLNKDIFTTSSTIYPSISPTTYPSIQPSVANIADVISNNPTQDPTQHPTHDNIDDIDDNNIEYVNSSPTLFNEVVISLIISIVLCIVLCICCISIGCCFYFYLSTNTNDKNDKSKDETDNENISLRPNISRRKPPPPPKISNQQIVEIVETGKDSENVTDLDIDQLSLPNSYNDDKEANMALLKSISMKFKKVASISMQKLNKQQQQHSDPEDNTHIIISPDSKSRTSISINSSQPGLTSIHSTEDIIDTSHYKSNHVYSLSMDQLYQLQHGLSIQTGDGIRIKLDKTKKQQFKQKYQQLSIPNDKNIQRNRVLSLIKTYKTKGGGGYYNNYRNVISKSMDRNSDDYHDQDEDEDQDQDQDLSSNESMYNKDDIETDDGVDDGYTTPTITSNKDVTIHHDEEGMTVLFK